MENLIQLVDIISSLEERSTTQQLCKNAANRPNIDCTNQLRRLQVQEDQRNILALV